MAVYNEIFFTFELSIRHILIIQYTYTHIRGLYLYLYFIFLNVIMFNNVLTYVEFKILLELFKQF